MLESPSEGALFAGVASMNRQPSALLNDGGAGADPEGLYPALAQFDSVEWMLLMDTLHYLVDDVLVKVDRASMASSLEVRVPFLDPEVFHTAWRIPRSLPTRRLFVQSLVPPENVDSLAEALAELMVNESLRHQMSKNTPVGLERFSQSEVRHQWLSLIDSVSNARG